MSQQEQSQKKSHNLLDDLTQEDLDKIDSYLNKGVVVDDYWMLLAEFGKAFGWEAYKDARDDLISIDEMMTLIEAHRRLESLDQYRISVATYIAVGSTKTKRPNQTFRKSTKQMLNSAKADM